MDVVNELQIIVLLFLGSKFNENTLNFCNICINSKALEYVDKAHILMVCEVQNTKLAKCKVLILIAEIYKDKLRLLIRGKTPWKLTLATVSNNSFTFIFRGKHTHYSIDCKYCT